MATIPRHLTATLLTAAALLLGAACAPPSGSGGTIPAGAPLLHVTSVAVTTDGGAIVLHAAASVTACVWPAYVVGNTPGVINVIFWQQDISLGGACTQQMVDHDLTVRLDGYHGTYEVRVDGTSTIVTV